MMHHYVTEKGCAVETVIEGHISRKIKAFDKNLMVVEVAFQNNAIGAEHIHTHEQISYCLDGVFDYSIEDKIHRLIKGDTIFVPENLRHGCKLISKTGTLLDIFTPCREDFVSKSSSSSK
ncbi:MAG: cupin domain-containing protein [Oscillospiraceae bacterium]